MTKILFMINYLTEGGPTRVVENILYTIDRQKFQPIVLTLLNKNSKKIVEKLQENDIDVIEMGYNKNLLELIRNKNNIIKKIIGINPDIVHTHGIVPTFIVANKNIKAKKITTIHNNIHEDYRYTYGLIKGFILAELHIRILKKFDETVCCSKTSYDLIKDKIENISFIRNGIDFQSNKNNVNIQMLKNELGINENGVIYIYIGKLNRRKRALELVKEFNDILEDNEYLLILGDGQEKNKIEKSILNKNIKLLGFKKNVNDYLAISDVYVSNSSSEGFSISIIEALSCGLALMLSDIQSHKECFEIDNEYYIGEYFNIKNIGVVKNNIKNNLNKKTQDRIKEFQKKYLSASVMTNGYEEKYIKIKETTNK